MTVALPQQRADRASRDGFSPVPSLRVAAALAVPEAWRIVRHPVALVGLTLHLVLFASVADNGPRDAFDVMSTASTFFYGVFVFFAANLVASRTRREGSRELLAPLAAGEHERTLALCLASLGPTLLNAVFNAGGYLMLELRGLFEVHPTFWHIAQGPLTVLGAALLGIMVARWAPYPGMALVVMVAMFAWNIWVSNDGDGDGGSSGPTCPGPCTGLERRGTGCIPARRPGMSPIWPRSAAWRLRGRCCVPRRTAGGCCRWAP